ncbi:class I SAM-dependent methyltransferase [Klenkia terrae]|uniref:class I SAM-dependent methyltransferase n=1 Tax=Klenkia terrae TaxID=1052259 RepID=UPI0036092DC1
MPASPDARSPPLASDGYPLAGGVERREVSEAESVRANRGWWDAAAPAYLAEHGADLGDADFLWGPEGLREADARLLGDVAGRRVLEVGCGSAPCARWLTAAGAQVVALDLSAGMLARARELNASTGLSPPCCRPTSVPCRWPTTASTWRARRSAVCRSWPTSAARWRRWPGCCARAGGSSPR